MITLRPYQQRQVRQTHAGLRRRMRVLSVAPTGSGKRVVACWWAQQIVDRGRRLAVITDRRILVDQMADECKDHGIEYGLRMGSAPSNHAAPVQVCSLQTLVRRKWQDNPPADWLIVDEAHKDPRRYQELFDHYPTSKVVGLTATPVGPKGRILKPLYDEIVEPITNEELIREGYLLPTTVYAPSEPDVKGVSMNNGDFAQGPLSDRVQTCTVFADVFRWWQPYTACQTLVFCPGVAYAHGLVGEFEERGHTAAVIEAKTSRDDRKGILKKFNEGDIRVLISVDVLKEGFDAPIAQVGIDLQPNTQLRTYWQKLGRVKRPHAMQDKAIWLDFAGNFWRHPHPDTNPEWPEGDKTTADIVLKQREKAEKKPWCCRKCAYTLAPGEMLDRGKCPQCGEKVGQPTRRIRMEDGTMREVSAVEKKKRERSEKDKACAAWVAILRNVNRKGGLMRQARFVFKKSTGKWPNKHMPCVPEWDSADWNRPVREIARELV